MLKQKGIFKTKEIFFVLVLVFIIYVEQSFIAGFLGVYIMELGYSQNFIGVLVFVSAMSEVLILLNIQKTMNRFGALKILKFIGIMEPVSMLLASAGNVPMLFLSQNLAGMTFITTYYSCVIYINENVIPGRQAQGQSILAILQAGIGSVVGNVLGGYLVGSMGIVLTCRIIAFFILGFSISIMLLHHLYLVKKEGIT